MSVVNKETGLLEVEVRHFVTKSPVLPQLVVLDTMQVSEAKKVPAELVQVLFNTQAALIHEKVSSRVDGDIESVGRIANLDGQLLLAQALLDFLIN